MMPARLLCLVLCAVLAWWPATAHLTPNSEIGLAIGRDGIEADIIVPQGEYAYATGNPVDNGPVARALAKEYLVRHFAVASPDGRRWSITLEDVAFVHLAGPPDLHATARIVPPRGASPRHFQIKWTALLTEIPSHFALFVVTTDDAGMIGKGREVLGAVRAGNPVIDVDRGTSSARVAFANSILLGVDHIAVGYDHLLFLLALLLPSPLLARDGRWREQRTLRDTVIQLLKIVTAFTIGHSLTLFGATLGSWTLPVGPVEIAIALSVLVSAIHAIRPLVPGREQYVALGFGLVHGLAFATLLHDAGAGASSTAASLLGFNLGIELVQLGIVALIMPALFALSRKPVYRRLRILLAVLTAGAAMVWVTERTIGFGARSVEWIDALMHHGMWGVAALYGLALLMARPAPTSGRA